MGRTSPSRSAKPVRVSGLFGRAASSSIATRQQTEGRWPGRGSNHTPCWPERHLDASHGAYAPPNRRRESDKIWHPGGPGWSRTCQRTEGCGAGEARQGAAGPSTGSGSSRARSGDEGGGVAGVNGFKSAPYDGKARRVYPGGLYGCGGSQRTLQTLVLRGGVKMDAGRDRFVHLHGPPGGQVPEDARFMRRSSSTGQRNAARIREQLSAKSSGVATRVRRANARTCAGREGLSQ